MRKETTLIAITLALVILLVAGIFLRAKMREGEAGDIDPFRTADANALPSVEGGTREKLAGTVAVPEVAGSTSTAVNADTLPIEGSIAIPDTVQKINDFLARRVFSVNGKDNAFDPPNIVVNEGDVVVVKFTAVDKDYDIFFPDFGIYALVMRGDTKQISFQAYPYGDYRFFCKEKCSGSAAGRLVVNQNQ